MKIQLEIFYGYLLIYLSHIQIFVILKGDFLDPKHSSGFLCKKDILANSQNSE